MLTRMTDSAHDREHIYRVLYTALDIAQTEADVDYDVLIASCLLHDIGREAQFKDPAVCHAQAGAEQARAYLLQNGYDAAFAEEVADCIRAHRFRSDREPESIEAKILFDADKIDATGTLGIARTIFYKGQTSEPLYSLDGNGTISDGTGDETASFFRSTNSSWKDCIRNFIRAARMKSPGRGRLPQRAFIPICFARCGRRTRRESRCSKAFCRSRNRIDFSTQHTIQ